MRSAAGPGFVNLRLSPGALLDQVPVILRAGEGYGDGTVGAGVRVNVEYVSANPTGPMHIGHCRGAVVGDALAAVLAKAGYAVTTEYYVNDAGGQVQALGWAAYWRYLQAIGSPITAEDVRRRDADRPAISRRVPHPRRPCALRAFRRNARHARSRDRRSCDLWFDRVRDLALSMMMTEIRADLALLGVRQEVFSSERLLLETGAVDRAIATLDAKGLIYEGVLEPPKGKTPDDWEPRPQTLFRATESSATTWTGRCGSPTASNTYFANDIAYHADKVARVARR